MFIIRAIVTQHMLFSLVWGHIEIVKLFVDHNIDHNVCIQDNISTLSTTSCILYIKKKQ